MVAEKKDKKPTRQQLKAAQRAEQGLVVRSRSIRVYARTPEAYRSICDHIWWYRQLARHLVSVATATLGATSRIARVEKKPPGELKGAKTRQANKARKAAEAGEEFEAKPIPETKLVVRFDYDKHLEYLEQHFGPVGKVPWYALRPYFMMFTKQLAAEGGPVFAKHMWDITRDRLKGMVDTKMPDYNDAPRSALILSGVLDNIKCRQLGMPVLCAPDCKQVYAWVHEVGKELFVTLQAGLKADRFDLVAHGGQVDFGKKTFTPKLNAGHKSLLHKLATGVGQLTTPTINLNKDGSLYLQVPHVVKARRGKNFERLNKDNVLEICFKNIPGHELPRKKNDKGKDDGKIFVIHCFKRGSTRKFRIPVNGAVADVLRYSAQQRARELQRDCQRKWQRSLVRSLREKVFELTKKRERRQADANHAWTRWIVSMADKWLCGTIKVFGPPDGTTQGLLLDGSIPWRWFEFMTFLTYKAEEAGMVIETETAEPAILEELFTREEEAVGSTEQLVPAAV